MLHPLLSTVLTTLLAALVAANTPVPDATVQAALLVDGGLELALQSRPIWHFASMRPPLKSKYEPSCWPAPALVDGKQNGTQPQKWPDASTGCAPIGSAFPTYYVVKQCQPDEIRIIYSLYFQHDGFSDQIITKGHEHDWERVIVVWKKNAADGMWRRSSMLLSMHSGYTAHDWKSVHQTVDYLDINKNGKDLDAPKVYVGWAKHPNFQNRDAGWRDPVSQGCQREYRSDNWRYVPAIDDMIWAAKGSPEGDLMATFNWGSATGGPWVSEDRACAAKQGGFIAC